MDGVVMESWGKLATCESGCDNPNDGLNLPCLNIGSGMDCGRFQTSLFWIRFSENAAG